MRVRFWGTRGSIAKPGPTTLRYGGNTPCVEVRAGDGTLLVLDCGTGIHGLGRSLLASGQGPLKGYLLITHFHWDHIQGFPFFVPLFIPGNEWTIHGPGGLGQHLETLLSGQMNYSYFPITLDEFGAEVRFTDLGEGSFDLGPFRITTQYTNHPALTLGFRIESGGAALVYIPDHEPYSLFPLDAPPGTRPLHHEDRRHVEFISGADLLIHDAQYSLDEYPAKISWGHSPYEKAVDYAIAGRAARLALFHHDPLRDDEAVEAIASAAAARAREGAHRPEVFAAAEGQTIELAETATGPQEPITKQALAPFNRADPPRPCSVLLVDDDPVILKLLESALEAEEFLRPESVSTGRAALDTVKRAPPSLILLDLSLPDMNGVEVCRRIRAHEDVRLRHVPIIIVTGKRMGEKDMEECFEAGASDYITKHFSPTQIRSRVKGWLLRADGTA